MPQRYEDLINQIAAQERVPAQVAQALVDTENPKRDPSLLLMERWGGGSYGLTMITLWTARSLGFAGPTDGLKDPTTQLRFGFKYLRRMFDKVGEGSWTRARAAYVAGPDLSPWPEQDLVRFAGHLARWKGRAPDFRKPPLRLAGAGGLMLLLLAGLFLPKLLKGGSR